MKKVIQASDKTRQLAIAKAIQQLGCTEDDISVVVLQNETKGFLGFGGKPCIVEVTLLTEEEEEPVAPVVEEKPAPVEKIRAKEEKPEKPARPVEKRAEKKVEKKEEPKVEKAERKPAVSEVPQEKMDAAAAFLEDVIGKMGVEVHTSITSQAEEMKVVLSGPDMGVIIGRRGETLDALQYLTSLVVNKDEEGYIKVTLDTENYRQKREETLVRLATKLAGKAVKYRRNISLEPMNPYERRIIHAALQDFEGVSTYSTGSEPNRKVIIACDGVQSKPTKASQEGRGGRGRGGEGRGYRGDRRRGDRKRSYREDRRGDDRSDEPMVSSATGYKPTPVAGEKLARAAKED
ncbi:MAG: RNA-binding cell elongation regulator Jag/EloR [Eubacteriales bacterium]|jgi:spoIIIJ-associated protein